MMFWFLIGVYVGHRAVLLQLTKLHYGVDLFFEHCNGEKVMNKYIHTKGKTEYKWYEHYLLMPYIEDLKYNEFIENTDEHFQKVKIINFDIIHHECKGDELEYSKKFYQTIENKDFKDYDNNIKEEALTTAIKSERKDIFIDRALIEGNVVSNSIFVKRSKLTKKTTDDRKSLNF